MSVEIDLSLPATVEHMLREMAAGVHRLPAPPELPWIAATRWCDALVARMETPQ